MKRRSKEPEFHLAIVHKESRTVIGEIETVPEAGDPNGSENAPRDAFSPCWMLHHAYQDKGYAYEAAYSFFDCLFRASQRLCKKLGMRCERLFQEFVSFVNLTDGSPQYENTLQYAILKKSCGVATCDIPGKMKNNHWSCFVIRSVSVSIQDGNPSARYSSRQIPWSWMAWAASLPT